MKKIIIVLITLVLITGCLGKEDASNYMDSSYNGIWVLPSSIVKDGSTIKEATFQFLDNGDCIFAFNMNPSDSTSVLSIKYEGKCYLNESKTKFKMEAEKSIFKEWVSFKSSGNSITIDDMNFNKK